jgi:hypothetical protein
MRGSHAVNLDLIDFYLTSVGRLTIILYENSCWEGSEVYQIMNAKSDATGEIGSNRGAHQLGIELTGSAVASSEPEALTASLLSRFPMPEGIRKSKDAFFRDLADLIGDPSLRGKWVAYHGDERIGIAADDEPLINECRRRGLAADEYILETIEARPATPEQIEFPLALR